MTINSYDGSTRFFNYIVNTLNVKSYFPKLIKFNKDNTFVYKCGLGYKEYKTIYSERPLVKNNEDILPLGVGKKTRKLIPPKLTISQFKRLSLFSNDVSVKLIAFPIILININSLCGKIKNNRKHLVVSILNKATGTLEVFDDKLPSSIEIFGEKFLLKKTISDLMIPKMQTLVPMENPLTIVIPQFNERYYKLFMTTLSENGYSADNYTAHTAFTANYLSERIKHPELSFDEIHTNIIKKLRNHTKEFLECFDILRNSTPKPMPCDLPEEILNPETLRCVKSDSNTGKRVQGLVSSKKANKINIHEHFLDSQLSETYLFTTEIGANHALSMRYLQSKYGSISSISKGVFKWNTLKLTASSDFKETWENGMTNPEVRYIVFGILLTSPEIIEGHANSLIYDKTTRELERYEPNGGDYNEFDTVGLDNAITKYFGDRIGTYIPPMLVCPIGFQRIDANELNYGAKDIGGNCAVWALYYMELRLANPLFTRKQIVDSALKGIRKRGSFIMFINGYHRHIQLAMRQLRKKVKN